MYFFFYALRDGLHSAVRVLGGVCKQLHDTLIRGRRKIMTRTIEVSNIDDASLFLSDALREVGDGSVIILTGAGISTSAGLKVECFI